MPKAHYRKLWEPKKKPKPRTTECMLTTRENDAYKKYMKEGAVKGYWYGGSLAMAYLDVQNNVHNRKI